MAMAMARPWAQAGHKKGDTVISDNTKACQCPHHWMVSTSYSLRTQRRWVTKVSARIAKTMCRHRPEEYIRSASTKIMNIVWSWPAAAQCDSEYTQNVDSAKGMMVGTVQHQWQPRELVSAHPLVLVNKLLTLPNCSPTQLLCKHTVTSCRTGGWGVHMTLATDESRVGSPWIRGQKTWRRPARQCKRWAQAPYMCRVSPRTHQHLQDFLFPFHCATHPTKPASHLSTVRGDCRNPCVMTSPVDERCLGCIMEGDTAIARHTDENALTTPCTRSTNSQQGHQCNDPPAQMCQQSMDICQTMRIGEGGGRRWKDEQHCDSTSCRYDKNLAFCQSQKIKWKIKCIGKHRSSAQREIGHKLKQLDGLKSS